MKKTEICLQCGDDFLPKRRGVQKFCSNSCRSRNWLLKRQRTKAPVLQEDIKNQTPSIIKKEGMSLAGMANAAAGAATVEVVKNIFTTQDNKPATKKDIKELKAILTGTRYFPINNFQNDAYGRKPFYDIETGNIVYTLT